MRDKQAGRQAASRQDHLVGPGRLPCCRDRGRSVAARNNKESWAREEAGKGDREGRGEGGESSHDLVLSPSDSLPPSYPLTP